jgi:hypothetical protein
MTGHQREILGSIIVEDGKGYRVENGTLPLIKRKYYGKDIEWDNVSCFNKHTQQFTNVEYFSPVIFDISDPMPKYNPKWEVYNSTAKNKKLIHVEFPKYYVDWWTKQEKRCLEGYDVGGVHITGRHYFYLNFWRIKTKEKGKGYIPPRFLDIDKMFFDDIDEALRLRLNYLVLKRRQIGVSEKVVGGNIAYDFTFFPGAESLIIAGEAQFADQSFDKLKNGLDEMSRFSDSNSADAFFKRRTIDNQEVIKSGFDWKGTVKGFKSVVYKRVAKHNTQIASGLSVLSTVFFEEAGRFPDMDIVDGMVTPIMEEGGIIGIGKIKIYVGTGGEMDKGAALLEQYFYNPEEYNLLSFKNDWDDTPDDVLAQGGGRCARFFPAWLYYVTDYDGNSYKDIGEVLLSEKRSKIKDPIKLHTEKTQMPLKPTEAFLRSGKSPFDVVKLEEQKNRIIKNNVISTYKWGRLDPVVDANGKITGMQWETGNPSEFDHEGDLKYPICVIDFPIKPKGAKHKSDSGLVMLNDARYDNIYFAGTDSYDKDQAYSSDSLGSISIFLGDVHDQLSTIEGRKFVARMTWRPSKKEKFFKMSAYMCMYYGAMNLIEWSNITIFDWYKNNEFEHYLKERPAITYATVKDSLMTNKYGVDPQTKYIWENNFKEYIQSYAYRWWDKVGVERAIAYRASTENKRYNCDITIGEMLAFQNFKDSEGQKIGMIEVNVKKKAAAMIKGLSFMRKIVGNRATYIR